MGLGSLLGGLFKALVYRQPRGGGRLPAGHGLRRQRHGGGTGHDPRGRHGHRAHHRQRRGAHGDLHHPGHLTMAGDAHITVSHLTMAYDDFVIQRDLDFTVRRGEVFIIMGGSGCGKTHAAQAHDRAEGARRRATSCYDGRSFWNASDEERGQTEAQVRRAVPGRRAVELHDARRERRAAAAPVHAPRRRGDPRHLRLQALARRARGLRGLLSERDLRRHEEARRPRARHGARSRRSCSSTSRPPGLDPDQREAARRADPGTARQPRHHRRRRDATSSPASSPSATTRCSSTPRRRPSSPSAIRRKLRDSSPDPRVRAFLHRGAATDGQAAPAGVT